MHTHVSHHLVSYGKKTIPWDRDKLDSSSKGLHFSYSTTSPS